MKILVAGGTGAVGRQLVPLLVQRGHQVFATTRTPQKVEFLRAAGAEPIVVDGLDAEGLRQAALSARPDVVVHQMTALSGMKSMRNVDKTLALSGPNSIIGKAVIIHEKADDFTTQPTGNAGARQACGVIEAAK